MNQSELKSFFYGTLLGDSYIHNNTFYCKQITKGLIEYKAKIIKQYLPDAKVWIKECEGYTDKNGVNHQKYYVLNASSSEYIKKLSFLFYPNGIKIVDKKILKYISPIGLAMWYADDGTTILVGKNSATGSSRSRRIQLCTDSFQSSEVVLLQQALIEYGLKTTLSKRNNTYRLNINPQDAQKMFNQIYPYFEKFFPELLYKMDMGYRNESLDNLRYVNSEYKKLYLKMSAHKSFIDRMKDK